ncbi:MAG: phosphatidylglycerophosphatase A [Deltaproteobacteria bacterium]|nr:phosphatidylglycerophosphatase A [Deltaproteobacteria bacterium]
MYFTLRLFVTGFYSGLSPVASGTTGSLAFLFLWLAPQLLGQPITPVVAALIAIALAVAGIVATDTLIKMSVAQGQPLEELVDPKFVVIDEWAGMAVALIAVNPTSAVQLLSAFLLFRALDVVKPWPIYLCERAPGAFGIMLDDIVAGAAAMVILFLIFH